ITFIAKDLQNKEISRSSVNVNVLSQTPINTTPIQTKPEPITPLLKLYVNPNNPAQMQAKEWAISRPVDSQIMEKIGNQSTAKWFGGWNADITGDVSKYVQAAKSKNSLPTLVIYNIPNRDCGSYSSGGADSNNSYLSWIQKVSNGLEATKVIIILEPDSLANIDCLSIKLKTERYSMLKRAIEIIKTNNPSSMVYIDAGHSKWINANEIANRLNSAGISLANGFSLNVSNFISTEENIVYGQTVSNLTNKSHFVIDTSRNGVGSNGEWCNPSGRALGKTPTLSTGNILIDAFLWIKVPGESDGNCNGGPNAGVWWPEYALDMAKRAGY
ncbi:MAG: glycoside hydrolase family 6 protein, partial [bacterium]|nr:glycoside hydrolase family 6 protein [bacterium]